MNNDTLDLVDRIYAAAVDSGAWDEVVAGMAKQFPGTKTAILLGDTVEPRCNLVATMNWESYWLDLYERHYGATNPWIERIGRIKAGRVLPAEEILPTSELVRTAFYHEWWAPQRMRSGAVALVFNDTIRFMKVSIDHGLPEHDPAYFPYLTTLLPHLERAAQISRQLVAVNTERQLLIGALDQLAVGAILLTKAGKVLVANRLAESILRVGRGLRVNPGGILVAEGDAGRTLALAIRQATDTACGRGNGAGATLSVGGAAGGPMSVLVAPLGTRMEFIPLHGAAAIVFVKTPEVSPDQAHRLIGEQYRLTPAEQRLLVALADGVSLAEFAERRGIAITTAKTQIRSIFGKTDCARQSDLVRLVSNHVAAFVGKKD